MSATVNIFRSAFSDRHETVEVPCGILCDVLELDYDNTVVFVNGRRECKEYELKDGDFCSVRIFPSGAEVWGPALAYAAVSLLVSIAIAEVQSFLLYGEEFFYHTIKSLMSKSSTPSETEQIPVISGGSNQSGKGKCVPLIIGQTYYTPDYCAQSYMSIDPYDGSDGENQYFNALHMIGYRDIDLKSVSLGIYELSTDEKNGTSGSLRPLGFLDKNAIRNVSEQKSSTFTYNAPVSKYSGSSYSGNHESSYGTPLSRTQFITVPQNCTIKDVSISGVDAPKAAKFSVEHSVQGTKILLYEKCQSISRSFTAKYTVSYSYYPNSSKAGVGKYDPEEYAIGLELRQDGNEAGLYPQKVVQEDFNSEMVHPEGAAALVVMPFSARYPQKCELEIQFSGLIRYEDDGDEASTDVTLGVAFSLDGGKTYRPFSSFIQSSGSVSVTSWPSDTGSFKAGTADYSGQCMYVNFKAKKNKQMRFIANRTFSYSEAMNCTNHAAEFLIWRESETSSDTRHNYKVQFSSIRTWCYDFEASKGKGYLVPQRPMSEKLTGLTARLAFRIKAGSDISGQLDTLNCIVKSRARICRITCDDSGEKHYSWTETTYPTNNPASLALMVLEHPGRGIYAYTDKDIDLDSFGRFYEWCSEIDGGLDTFDGYKYVANGAVSRQMKTMEIVGQILAVGHGRLVISGAKYGVWIDRPQQNPVMVMSNQNLLDFSCVKNFDETVDGYNVKFVDSLNYYQESAQIVADNAALAKTDKSSPSYDPDYELRLDDLELPFVTDMKRVYRECMYRLACRRLRPETWTAKLGIDGNIPDYGDMVEVQTDTLCVGIGDGAEVTGLVLDGTRITGIQTDGKFYVSDPSLLYGLKIMQADGVSDVSVIRLKVDISEAGFYSEFALREDSFIDSASGAARPTKGDFVSFGIFDRITAEALVTGKKDNGDGTFQFTLVPYQEGIYSDEVLEGNIPEFESNVTSPLQSGVTDADRISEIYSELNDLKGEINSKTLLLANDGLAEKPVIEALSVKAEKDGLKINVLMKSGKYNAVRSFSYEIDRGKGYSAVSADSSGLYKFDREKDFYPEESDLLQWKVRVMALSVYGLYSEHAECGAIDCSGYGTWHVQPPVISPRVSGRNVSLHLEQPRRSDGKEIYGTVKYLVLVKKPSDSGYFTPSESADPYESEDSYRTDGTDGLVSDSLYQQVMPLEGQNSVMKFTTVTTRTEKFDGYREKSVTETEERPFEEGDTEGVTEEEGQGNIVRVTVTRKIEERSETEVSERPFEEGDTEGVTESAGDDGSRIVVTVTVVVSSDNDGNEVRITRTSVETIRKVLVTSTETVMLVPNVTEAVEETVTSQWAEGDTEGTETHTGESEIVTVTRTVRTEDASNPVDTAYMFMAMAFNSVSGFRSGEGTEVTVIALATSARDIVSSAITTNKIAEGAVTMDKLHANCITAEKMASRDLAVMNMVLGKVSGTGIASDESNYWDLETGEFRIGNSIGYEDTETGEPLHPNASYLHFKSFGGVKGLAIAISKFIVTSAASIIKGIFKVQNDSSHDDFMIVNPSNKDDAVTGVSAKTLKLKGDAVIDGLLSIRGADLTSGNSISNSYPGRIGAGRIQIHTVYNANGPATYGNLINIGGNGAGQLFLEWSGSQSSAGGAGCGRVFYRSWRDNQNGWTAWRQVGGMIPTSTPSSPENGMIWIE